MRQRERGHDPGRVAVDLAVMIADGGGEAIADVWVLRYQVDLSGKVAWDPTAWWVMSTMDRMCWPVTGGVGGCLGPGGRDPRRAADSDRGWVDADGYPDGTRVIVRRERPHPGGQLSLFDTIEGMRHQVMATDTPPRAWQYPVSGGSPPCARPRRHRQDTGFGRFPLRCRIGVGLGRYRWSGVPRAGYLRVNADTNPWVGMRVNVVFGMLACLVGLVSVVFNKRFTRASDASSQELFGRSGVGGLLGVL